MTATDLTASNKPPAKPPIGFFERYLTVWVALCIVAGVLAGQFFPAMFQTIGRMQYAQVNLPVGLLIWVMIIPMLVKVDFGSLHEVRQHLKGIGVTLVVNWLVKPFRWRCSAGCSSSTCSLRCCLQRNSTVTLRASSCWPPRPARRWCSSGAG
jgi:hypothetical protein